MCCWPLMPLPRRQVRPSGLILARSARSARPFPRHMRGCGAWMHGTQERRFVERWGLRLFVGAQAQHDHIVVVADDIGVPSRWRLGIAQRPQGTAGHTCGRSHERTRSLPIGRPISPNRTLTDGFHMWCAASWSSSPGLAASHAPSCAEAQFGGERVPSRQRKTGLAMSTDV